MRLAPLTALLACAVALGPEAVLAEHRFEIDVGADYIEGKGAQTETIFTRRIRDIDDAKSSFVALSWLPNESWTVRLEYTQSFMRYEDPSNEFCPASAGLLTGFQFCQLGLFPRSGRLRDDYHATELSAERSWNVREHGAVRLGAGYQLARWSTRDDHEIQTFSTCVADVFPVVIPQCQPINLRAKSDGPFAELSYEHQFSHSIGASLGFHWQATSYVIHRNDAIPRFCGSFAGLQQHSCNSRSPEFVPADTSANHDWTWWFGEVSWRVNESWELALTGESGGSRDWDSLGTSIRYRW